MNWPAELDRLETEIEADCVVIGRPWRLYDPADFPGFTDAQIREGLTVRAAWVTGDCEEPEGSRPKRVPRSRLVP
jgi:hypothetical protein